MDIQPLEMGTEILGEEQQLQDFYNYAKNAKSPNTLRSYRNAWMKYVHWCDERGANVLLTNYPFEVLIGMFISDMAKNRKLKVASISAYLAGIRHHYHEKGYMVDTGHKHIRDAMSGIRRELGKKQNQKLPLKTEMIKSIIESIDEDQPIGLRDSALILMGFSGAFRRSELVGIDIEHLIFDSHGLSVYLPRSKTDQDGEGRVVDIPFSTDVKFCPIRKLRRWISLANILEGPVFLQVHKGGNIVGKRICDHTVARILKKRCEPFGFSSEIAGHSLRAGHVTSAIKNGVPETWIMRQTGHTSINTLKKYERLQREFTANSAAKIGL